MALVWDAGLDGDEGVEEEKKGKKGKKSRGCGVSTLLAAAGVFVAHI